MPEGGAPRRPILQCVSARGRETPHAESFKKGRSRRAENRPNTRTGTSRTACPGAPCEKRVPDAMSRQSDAPASSLVRKRRGTGAGDSMSERPWGAEWVCCPTRPLGGPETAGHTPREPVTPRSRPWVQTRRKRDFINRSVFTKRHEEECVQRSPLAGDGKESERPGLGEGTPGRKR